MKTPISQLIRTISLFLCVIFIASCGGSDSGRSTLEEKVLDDFTISLPASWPLVSKDSDGVPKPSSGQIALIASASEAQNGFANNMVILERKLSSITTSNEYALASKTWLEEEFYYYKEKESEDLEFLDEEVSNVSVFLAQYNIQTPMVYYIQSARVCWNKAFTITVAVEKSITDFSRYKALISTFSCKVEK